MILGVHLYGLLSQVKLGAGSMQVPAIAVGCMRLADKSKEDMIGNDAYKELNDEIDVLAEKYGVSATTIATAWILRHPANMQVVTGTASEDRLSEIIDACKLELTRQEWYTLYLAAGHPLP